MFRDAKLGMQHSILSTNFKLFKYFSASTSLNYEVCYAKQKEIMTPTKVK
jgi:hypothetical protein